MKIAVYSSSCFSVCPEMQRHGFSKKSQKQVPIVACRVFSVFYSIFLLLLSLVHMWTSHKVNKYKARVTDAFGSVFSADLQLRKNMWWSAGALDGGVSIVGAHAYRTSCEGIGHALGFGLRI